MRMSRQSRKRKLALLKARPVAAMASLSMPSLAKESEEDARVGESCWYGEFSSPLGLREQ